MRPLVMAMRDSVVTAFGSGGRQNACLGAVRGQRAIAVIRTLRPRDDEDDLSFADIVRQ